MYHIMPEQQEGQYRAPAYIQTLKPFFIILIFHRLPHSRCDGIAISIGLCDYEFYSVLPTPENHNLQPF
ncbi:hypothetical protein QYF36_012786 [Acer negundo]|nr:hypothetical protein QYF36_012786 [Acer negundo]